MGFLVPQNASKALCNAILLIVFHYSWSRLSFPLKEEKKGYIYIYMRLGTQYYHITCHLHLCHIMCIRRWNTKHVTLFLFKGFKLRSLSLSPSLSKPLCKELVKMRCKSHVRLSNQKYPSPHMLCSTSGPLNGSITALFIYLLLLFV